MANGRLLSLRGACDDDRDGSDGAGDVGAGSGSYELEPGSPVRLSRLALANCRSSSCSLRNRILNWKGGWARRMGVAGAEFWWQVVMPAG